MARPVSKTPPLRYHKPTRNWYVFTGGKRIYLGRNKPTAEQRRLQIIGATIQGQPVDAATVAGAGGMTLSEALIAFREYANSHYSDDRARMRYKSIIEATVKVHGATPADRFDGQCVDDVRAELLSRTKPKKLSRKYINCLIRALKTAFAWMRRRKIVSANTLAEVREVKALMPGEGGRETLPIPPVEDWVIDATSRECTPTIRAMIDLQRITGMRPGELVIMRPCDLTTDANQSIHVPGQNRTIRAMDFDGVLVWFYVPPRHKTMHRGKMRIVPIGPAGQAILKPFLSRRDPSDYVFKPSIDLSAGQCRALCVGDYYPVRSYHNAIGRAVIRANKMRRQAVERGLIPAFIEVPAWHPNQLRHAAAESVAEKIDAESAANLLGHSASRRALDSYIQACIKRAGETAAKIG